MRKLGVMVALAVVMSWSLGTPAALAKTCAKLYKECQEVLKTSKADAATKEKAKKMCEEGIELHRNGKSAADHEKSVEIQKEALALLGVKK